MIPVQQKTFLKIRAAFEEIQQDEWWEWECEGSSSRGGRMEASEMVVVYRLEWTELREWYQEETGDFATLPLPSTRQRSREVYKTMLQWLRKILGLCTAAYGTGGVAETESDDEVGPMKLLKSDSKSPSVVDSLASQKMKTYQA
jgi:hypothetical protein